MAAEAGFEGVEIMVNKRLETQDAGILKGLSAKHGVPVKCVHAPFLLMNRSVWGNYAGKIERSVDLASALGAETVVVHLPYFWHLAYARWLKNEINSFTRCNGAILAVENAILINVRNRVNFSFFNDLNGLKMFDHVTFDTSHFAISRVDILEAWRELKERVAHVHLSDNRGHGFDDHALPLQGELPLGEFLSALRRDGYAGLISLELSPRALESNKPERVVPHLRESLEFCRSHYNG